MPTDSGPTQAQPDNASALRTPQDEAHVEAGPRIVPLLSILVIAAFVVILNETIMSVAMRPLMGTFDVTAATVQWLTTAFMLTMAVVIPTTGWLLTRLKLRTVFIIAMTSFCVGTLVSAFAQIFPMLVTGRVIQAVGTAIMMPLLMTTIMNAVDPAKRGRTMGVVSIVIAVAPATGPTVGGFILDLWGWRWMFGVVLPIAALILVLGLFFLRNLTEPRPVPLDAWSVVLSALGFAGLVYGLASVGESVSGNAVISPWVPLGIGLVGLALFVWRQAYLKDNALLDLRTLTRPLYSLALAIMLTGMIALFGTIILLPMYIQQVLGASTATSGVAVLPGGLLMGVLGWFVGRLYDATGPRPLVIPGAVLASVGLWGMALFLGTGTPIWLIMVLHTVLSAGLAFMFGPLMTAALGALPTHLYPHGSALLTTLQQVAGAAGTALFITLLTTGSISATAEGASELEATMAGTHTAFLWGAIISVLAVLGALFIRRTPAGQVSGAAHA